MAKPCLWEGGKDCGGERRGWICGHIEKVNLGIFKLYVIINFRSYGFGV